MSDFSDIDTNPLIVCHTAENKPDGIAVVTFRNAQVAQAWAMRFIRKNTRRKNDAKKAMQAKGQSPEVQAMNMASWEDAMKFACTRSGSRVEVHYLPKAQNIVSVE